MNPGPKLRPAHLERQAVVYIRQSSLRQVAENLESQDLQYALQARAVQLGWPAGRVRVIDDDLGKSAVSAQTRQGFQDLAAAMGLGQVGIVLVTDVSRLARNCTDWYQLLDLAAHFDVLICDTGGIYDPRSPDDRLLLGLKGTFSELQWHQIRDQLGAARVNKARRGELRLRLPVGFVYSQDGATVKTPDSQVQDTLTLVFDQFKTLGSTGKLLRYLRDHGVMLPRLRQGELVWERPSSQVIYQFLKQPAYAGAYAYGKLERRRLPGQAGTVVLRKRSMQDWPVLIHDHHPAYLSWDDFLQNQQRLADNAQGASWTRGAPRDGAALLQGIAFCGRCGRALHVHYTHSPAYICDYDTRRHGGPRCQTFNLKSVDPLITQLVLAAVQPARIAAALAALDQLETQRQALAQHWQQRLARTRYDADLAARRYRKVDPDNRLVAAELEKAWEERLRALAQLERDWQAFQTEQLQPLAEADCRSIRTLAEDLPALWQAKTTSQEDRKRLLRCLIRDVTLENVSQPGCTTLHIRWQSGATTSASVPLPGRGTPRAEHVGSRIRTLALTLTDEQIAERLNAEAFPTATGLPWTKMRVYAVRRKHRIPSLCPSSSAQDTPRGDGLVRAATAALRLGVHPSMISVWFKQGLIPGTQARPRAPVWIDLSDEVLTRLDGSASRLPDMIPLVEVERVLGLSPERLRDTILAGTRTPYRLFLDNCWHWFIRSTSPNPIHVDS